MHQISIQFKKAKKTTKYSIDLPDDWDQVTEKEFKSICKVLFTAFDITKLRLTLIQQLVFFKFNRAPCPPRPRWTGTDGLISRIVATTGSSIVLYELSECLSFLWKEPCSRAILPFIGKFSYPGYQKFYLPGDHFHQGSMIEYIYADGCLQSLMDNNNQIDSDMLDEMVAIICRPAKYFWFIRKRFATLNTGDCRQQFNAALVAGRKKRIAKLPVYQKIYVLKYFIACKLHIMEKYEPLFPKGESTARRTVTDRSRWGTTADSGGRSASSSWIEMLKSVAETKLYGSYDETAHYNLHTILTNAVNDLQRQKK